MARPSDGLRTGPGENGRGRDEVLAMLRAAPAYLLAHSGVDWVVGGEFRRRAESTGASVVELAADRSAIAEREADMSVTERPSVAAFYEREVLPELTRRLDQAFPEFGWR